AHAVDEGIVFAQPEKPALRVSFLWFWSKRTNFDKPESAICKFAVQGGVFIKACGKSNRIFEPEPENFPFQTWVVYFIHIPYQGACSRYAVNKADGIKSKMVYFFRIKPKKQWPDKRFVHSCCVVGCKNK
ncbi:hypothetical protein VF12_41085, partial [Nostoc linckia z15]